MTQIDYFSDKVYLEEYTNACGKQTRVFVPTNEPPMTYPISQKVARCYYCVFGGNGYYWFFDEELKPADRKTVLPKLLKGE